MKLKKLKTLMILLIFFLSCKTFIIRVESPNDFRDEYLKCKTHEDIHRVNAKKIIELKRIIYILETQVFYADGKNITVLDLRNENDKKEYKIFIEKNIIDK